jgi:hypothetical protein
MRLSLGYLFAHLNTTFGRDSTESSSMVSAVRQYIIGTNTSPSRMHLRTAVHGAKLMWCGGETRVGFSLLVDTVAWALEQRVGQLPESDSSLLDAVSVKLQHADTIQAKLESSAQEQIGRGLLRLGVWLQQRKDVGAVLLDAQLQDTLLIRLVDERLTATETSLGGALNDDNVVGSLYMLATHICPTLMKAQLRLADWAYKASVVQHVDGDDDDIQQLSRYVIRSGGKCFMD